MNQVLRISRIKSLKSVGIFREFSSTNSIPEMRQFNLVYGFNGSGKTTLARLFESFEKGQLNSDLPTESSFEIELSDGSAITEAARLDALIGKIFVFNTDFVDQNIRWREGTANGVFYISSEQGEQAAALESLLIKIASTREKRDKTRSDYDASNRTLINFKRDHARSIATELNLGRKFDATNLENEYNKTVQTARRLLSSDEVRRLQSLASVDAALPKVSEITLETIDLTSLVESTQSLATTEVGEFSVSRLAQHPQMIGWAGEGARYHVSNHLEECLLCGNATDTQRMEMLAAIIDQSVDQTVRGLELAKARMLSIRATVKSCRDLVPSVNDLSPSLREKARETRGNVVAYLSQCDVILDAIANVIQKKEKSLTKALNCEELLPPVQLQRERDISGRTWIYEINSMIAAHNAECDNFEAKKSEALGRLLENMLAAGEGTYRELCIQTARLKEHWDIIESELVICIEQETRIRRELRRHNAAAGPINRLMTNYLGYNELAIMPLEEGYEIHRNGQPAKGPLSEGEKTAIALSYFICLLTAEGRSLQDLVVVLDDPISSLDTRALNYAVSLIKSKFVQVGQLIVLTHNLHFMNELKKWLKSKIARDPGKGALYLLDVTQEQDQPRSASLCEMPKMLKDYDSEYHYLFQLALKFESGDPAYRGYGYLMPNVLRKVLEVFLAFRQPGPADLGVKIDAIASQNPDIDPAKIRALDRLVQLESHGDNLDDLSSLPPTTIEEAAQAASALFHLINMLDAKHFEKMSGICRQ